MARESWTDERLGDLKATVDGGFSDMRTEFSDMRTEFRDVRADTRALRAETSAQFAAQHRMMVQMFAGMFATVVVGFLGTIATILTQV